VEWVTVLANLASGGASQRVLCLSRSGFEGSSVGASCLVAVRTLARGSCLRRAGSRTVAGVAMSHRPVVPQCQGWRCSARDGGTAAGVTEKTRPAGLTSRHRPARARGRHPYLFRGFRCPPSRGATWGSYESGRHSVTDLTPALPHSFRTGRVGGIASGYDFQAVSGHRRGGDSPLTRALASC
jgi:hypothetical protein